MLLFTAILTAFIILFFFGTIWYMVKCIYKCTRNRNYLRRYILWTSEVETVSLYVTVEKY